MRPGLSVRLHCHKPNCEHQTESKDQRDELAPPHALHPKGKDQRSSIAGRAVHRSKSGHSMSAKGQMQTSCSAWTLSALPPKADKLQTFRFVRLVPKADSCSAAKSLFDHLVGAG